MIFDEPLISYLFLIKIGFSITTTYFSIATNMCQVGKCTKNKTLHLCNQLINFKVCMYDLFLDNYSYFTRMSSSTTSFCTFGPRSSKPSSSTYFRAFANLFTWVSIKKYNFENMYYYIVTPHNLRICAQ